ncbi:MAG: head GIN domain-containing protein [Acidobacteriota bacterium]
MKKLGLIVFVSALSIGLFSAIGCSFGNLTGVQGSGNAKSEKRNVSGFKEIEAGGAITLEIDAQKDFSVEVEADDNLLSLIKTEVSGDTLKISTEDKISSKTKIIVKISLPELTSLDISGASGAVVSNVKTGSLKLEASGASKIKISGEANSLESDASGASGIDAEGLRIEDAVVVASGASNTTVSAVNDLKADASGASTIYYTGEPKNVEPKSSGVSSIKKK